MGRRGEHAAHHGGAWKVAYADFVTAMMALFIVLWILSSSEKLKAVVAAYFNHPSVFKSQGGSFLTEDGQLELRKQLELIRQEEMADSSAAVEAALIQLGASGGGGDADEAERAALGASAKQLEETINNSETLRQIRGQVTIEFTSQGMRIQMEDLKERPLFAVGSSEPTAAGRELLRTVAKALAPLPNSILVEGHTDSRPYSDRTDYSNWELSGDRANAARRVLEETGLDPTRIARVVGYADRCLLKSEEPFSDQNRRISITVTYSGARID